MRRKGLFSWLSGIVVTFLLLAVGGPARAGTSVVEKVISTGEELRAPVDCRTSPGISIRLENLVESESVCWWTSFYKNKERSENEIGPLFIRTITLPRKVEKTNTADSRRIRLGGKTIRLRCIKTDEILVHVDKGKVFVKVAGK